MDPVVTGMALGRAAGWWAASRAARRLREQRDQQQRLRDAERRFEETRLHDTAPLNTPDLVLSVRGQLVALVEFKRWKGGTALAVFAALAARRAMLEGWEHWEKTVEDFARTWLPIPKVTAQWHEAVSTALIGDWADALDDKISRLDAWQLFEQDRKIVYRQLQPLWERKTGGHRLLMLDQPRAGWGAPLDVPDKAPGPEHAALPWEPETEWAVTVFGWLEPKEQAIARAWATNPGVSWAEAAQIAGIPNDGERVRTKLKRLGKRYGERQANAAMGDQLEQPAVEGGQL
ncbi:hypothetical protein [Streptomyces sp. NPDC046832]|uniref:hypothetical protein n=1 Tax=Streptomyces sp. NPDC046832 TaxID=3155020 RepID=UPI0033C0D3AE